MILTVYRTILFMGFVNQQTSLGGDIAPLVLRDEDGAALRIPGSLIR